LFKISLAHCLFRTTHQPVTIFGDCLFLRRTCRTQYLRFVIHVARFEWKSSSTSCSASRHISLEIQLAIGERNPIFFKRLPLINLRY